MVFFCCVWFPFKWKLGMPSRLFCILQGPPSKYYHNRRPLVFAFCIAGELSKCLKGLQLTAGLSFLIEPTTYMQRTRIYPSLFMQLNQVIFTCLIHDFHPLEIRPPHSASGLINSDTNKLPWAAYSLSEPVHTRISPVSSNQTRGSKILRCTDLNTQALGFLGCAREKRFLKGSRLVRTMAKDQCINASNSNPPTPATLLQLDRLLLVHQMKHRQRLLSRLVQIQGRTRGRWHGTTWSWTCQQK